MSFDLRSKSGPPRGPKASAVRSLVSLTATAAMGWSVSPTVAGTTPNDYAAKVISSYQGSGLPANYFNASSSTLGPPELVSGVGTIYPNVVDPFSPAFGNKDIFEIGKGGQITLQLSKAFTVANAPQLGIISNVGLIDEDYPAGKASGTASIFGGGIADVRVSSNAKTWVDLGNITFNIPTSSYTKLGNPYEAAPTKSDVESNFGKPFTGKLSNFDNETLAQALKTLNDSVGGTWLNVFGTKLKTVDYIQIRNPLGQPWTPGNPVRLAIDGVTVSTVPSVGGANPNGPGGTASGAGTSTVPLPAAAPAGLAMFLAAGAWQALRRKFARI